MKRYQLLILIAGFIAASFVGNAKASEITDSVNQGVYHCSNGETATIINNAVIINNIAYIANDKHDSIIDFTDAYMMITAANSNGDFITHTCTK